METDSRGGLAPASPGHHRDARHHRRDPRRTLDAGRLDRLGEDPQRGRRCDRCRYARAGDGGPDHVPGAAGPPRPGEATTGQENRTGRGRARHRPQGKRTHRPAGSRAPATTFRPGTRGQFGVSRQTRRHLADPNRLRGTGRAATKRSTRGQRRGWQAGGGRSSRRRRRGGRGCHGPRRRPDRVVHR